MATLPEPEVPPPARLDAERPGQPGAQKPPTADVWSDVSDRLRQARIAKDMTLRALAARIGVSPSLISQIETGKVKPSVNTLYALAVELDLSVDEVLFGGLDAPPQPDADATPVVHVQRAHGRASVELAPGVLWERLTVASEPGFDFLHLVYSPGGMSIPGGASHRHGGREWGYVMSGTLGVEVGGVAHVLEAGDSIAFSSADPHRLYNPGDTDTRAVWFILGRRDDDQAPDP